MHPSATSRTLRLTQAAILVVGAIVLIAVIGDSHTGFYWTPLTLGLTYLAGAIAGGRQGSYWATAVVLVGWGTAVICVRQFSPHLDTAGLYLAGAGIGATIGLALASRGFAVSPVGMTATIAIGGILLSFEPRVGSVLGDAVYYGCFLLLIAAVNLVLALAPTTSQVTQAA